MTVTLNKALRYLVFLFLGLLLLFNRPFVGIYIFNIQIGKYLIAASVLLSGLALLFFILKKDIYSPLKINNLLNIFFLSNLVFLIGLFIHNTNVMSSYTFKTSSYIWTLGYLFFAFFVFKDFEINKNFRIFLSYSFMTVPFIHYIFSTGFFPNFIIDFFNNYADKFEFTKASDIMLSLIIANLLNLKLSNNNFFKILYFTFSVSFLLPLLLFMSRGSFVSGVFFFLLVIFYYRKYFISKLRLTIFFVFISLISSITSLSNVSDIDFSLNFNNDEPTVVDAVQSVSKKNETRKAFLSLYIQDGRLMSKDNTTNWRLDIWQDVFEDMNKKNLLFSGYGHNAIIPVMTDPSAPGRLGRDGLNENVHNYFVTIFARGGVFQFILFIIFYIALLKMWKSKYDNYSLLIFLIPVLFNSTLDMSMEGVQYPLVFYLFLGYLFQTEEKYKICNFKT